MVLLNEEQVSAAVRESLHVLSKKRSSRRKRIALFAEREYAESSAFDSKLMPDGLGRMRMRAYGRVGRAPVNPKRGSTRVGSEGHIASIISQTCETWKTSFMNHPGPDRIRAASKPANTIAIVTDFIGSGKRVRDMLDTFWHVPSVRSWLSGRHIKFIVIAAAATAAGAGAVKRHRTNPEVIHTHTVPTVADHHISYLATQWQDLIDRYGPAKGRGAGRTGFGELGALVAFNYRIPNNTPAIIHSGDSEWNALYVGSAPSDLRPAFGMRSMKEVVAQAAENNGVAIADGILANDASEILLLSLLRGRWHPGTEVTLSQRTGINVPDVVDILQAAKNKGLVTESGRLTDAGQALLGAARRTNRTRPLVKSSATSYIPDALRTPRNQV